MARVLSWLRGNRQGCNPDEVDGESAAWKVPEEMEQFVIHPSENMTPSMESTFSRELISGSGASSGSDLVACSKRLEQQAADCQQACSKRLEQQAADCQQAWLRQQAAECRQAQLRVQAEEATGPPRLKALDGARFIAAILIVLYHFYEKEEWGALAIIMHWGSAWVQFFFALSGFVLAYGELTKPAASKKPTQLQYLQRRIYSIYPVYVFALITVVFESGELKHTDFEWSCLPLHFTLTQCWFARCSEWNPKVQNYQCCSQTWNSVAWYMSVLVPFWLLVRPLSDLLRTASGHCCGIALTACWLLSWVPAFGVKYATKNYKGVKWMQTYDMWNSSPAGYWHVFACGVPAARLFMILALEDADRSRSPDETTTRFQLRRDLAPWVFQRGASIGYAILLVIFFLVDYDDNWILLHNGGLLPPMLLIIWGLALGQDPIAAVFSREPFTTLGRLSYAMYIIQFRVWWLFFRLTGGPPMMLFPVALLASSYACTRWIEAPYAEWLAMRREQNIRGLDDKLVDLLDSTIGHIWSFARRCIQGRESTPVPKTVHVTQRAGSRPESEYTGGLLAMAMQATGC